MESVNFFPWWLWNRENGLGFPGEVQEIEFKWIRAPLDA